MSRLVPVGIAACTEPTAVDANRPVASRSAAVAKAQESAVDGALTEPAAYDGRVCELRFSGTPSRTAEFYAIWNLRHGILDLPFDTTRPDLYAIVPGTMHIDPEHPELDHDHFVSAAPGVPGYDGTWDVWVVVRGPDFDPATYRAPRSLASMMDLIALGVLAGPFGFSQAGFGPDDVARRCEGACAAPGVEPGARVGHSSTMTIHVRPATLADAPRLSQLGATTFRETFESANTPEDMARYVAEAFTPDRQATEITDTVGAVLLAEHRGPSGGAELVGYAHLVSGPAPAAVQGPAPMELKRLYVSRAWHGQGVAQALMDAALDTASARGARTLWLGVWERNPRAVAFYRKYGFTRVGEHTFVLGADTQTDWVLARPLGTVPPSGHEAAE